MADDKPYTVESPTRIRLGPEAKFWAKEHGMSLQEMARYLLERHRLGGDYDVPHGSEVTRDEQEQFMADDPPPRAEDLQRFECPFGGGQFTRKTPC
jgi:hypothetical protein